MVKWFSRPGFLVLAALSMNLVGCSLVKGVFKAGMWVGLIVGLSAAAVLMASRFRHSSRRLPGPASAGPAMT